MDRTVVWQVSLFVVFIAYNYLIFELGDRLLEGARLGRWKRLIVGIINAVVLVAASANPFETTLVSYIALIVLIVFEYSLFYKDRFRRVLFVSLAYPMHIMGIRAITTAIISVVLRKPFNEVSSDPLWYTITLTLTFILGCVAIIAVIRLIPMDRLRIVSQHDDQLTYVSLWISVVTLFFLVGTSIYSANSNYYTESVNQFAMAVSCIAGVYIMIFFVMRTGELLGYKERSRELAATVKEEQQFKESVLSQAVYVFEYNLTQDSVIRVSSDSKPLFNDRAYSYTEVISYIIGRYIFEDDRMLFGNFTSIDKLISDFNNNKTETSIECRKLDNNGEYVWVKLVTSLIKDKSGDIKGVTYAKDINEEKLMQIQLKYKAERDSLTGLYNKGMTEGLIGDFISTKTDYPQYGALFIIDVDNFKTINDRLGHIFGDVVLCEFSEKLRRVFRSASSIVLSDNREDIIGRVGGDEFMVFVKGTKDKSILASKASEICKAFYNTYSDKSGNRYTISASIGISIFPENGKSFAELYKYADIALYLSKNKGKDAYSFYQGEAFEGYESKRGEIDLVDSIPQKSFSQNRVEYVFKILFQAEDIQSAIQSVLQLLASSMNFSRGYIFETSKDGLTTSNTFEWCADGITPEIDNLQNISIKDVETSTKEFYSKGRFILTSLDMLPENERKVLEPQGIKSMLQFGLFNRDRLIGFIGFDDCVRERTPSMAEIDEMTTVCNVLATFILKERALELYSRTQF